MRTAGWKIVHLPDMTILHHAGKGGKNPRMEAQNAVARLHYARKHYSGARRGLFVAALAFGYAIRAAVPAHSDNGRSRRAASLRAFKTVARLSPPPFGDPPPMALYVAPVEHELTSKHVAAAGES